MLKKKLETIKKRSKFLSVGQSGKKWIATRVVVQARAEVEAKQEISVGYTASKKVGNAVARNKAKRRLRMLAHDVLALHSDASQDYVLIARQETVTCRFADLKADLIWSLKRMKLWRD